MKNDAIYKNMANLLKKFKMRFSIEISISITSITEECGSVSMRQFVGYASAAA